METVSATQQIASKVALVRELTRSLPINSFGLPEGFYRVDLLPLPTPPSNGHDDASTLDVDAEASPTSISEGLLTPPSEIESLPVNSALPSPTESNGESSLTSNEQIALAAHIDPSTLKSAYVSLSYQEGFPALPSGMPFWSRLDFEPPDEFTKFQSYLEEGTERARQIFMLADDNFSSSYLQEVAILHYWSQRARSYDMFKLASFRYQQEMRSVDMLDNHYLLAKRLLAKAKLYFEEDEFIELLTPSTAIDLLKTVVQLQRLSVGLPPGAAPPSSKDAPPAAGDIEVILRNLAPQQKEGSPTLTQQDDGSFALAKALENPETTAVAQELIIRIQQNNAA